MYVDPGFERSWDDVQLINTPVSFFSVNDVVVHNLS